MMSLRRAILISLVPGILLPLASVSPIFASARSRTRQGNRLYQEKKYDEALKRYTEAQKEAPDAPQLHYNLGNVYFRKGDLEKAGNEYRRALDSADPGLDPRAVYNLGNTFFTRQEYRDAIAAYQRALKLNPSDQDAKRNLELALLRMKQQQKQEPRGGDPKDEEKKEQQKQEQPTPSEGEQKKQDTPQKQQPQAGERKEKGSLSKEEAERILNALQEDEKENMKKQVAAAKEDQEEVEKDW
jgi:tetratricopeptide (TPR) repeat protein